MLNFCIYQRKDGNARAKQKVVELSYRRYKVPFRWHECRATKPNVRYLTEGGHNAHGFGAVSGI